MVRTDSGFDETFRLNALGKESSPIARSNTAPARNRKSKKISSNLDDEVRTSAIDSQYAASEKRPRKSTERRRRSITSSDSSTSKSRRRGHGSLPSSRRTSVTIVDPSRPARHYRIKSSQTCPTANRDIDDVLALHFRSCNLFQSPTYQSSLPSPTFSGHGSADADFGPAHANTTAAPHVSEDDCERISPKEDAEIVGSAEVANTTMHWTSPCSRRKEYEHIDKANSGLKGLLARIMPRCVSGPPPPKFYEDDKSDTASVRRYRMDMSDEEDVDEKSTTQLRLQSHRLERTATKKTAKCKRWGCF